MVEYIFFHKYEAKMRFSYIKQISLFDLEMTLVSSYNYATHIEGLRVIKLCFRVAYKCLLEILHHDLENKLRFEEYVSVRNLGKEELTHRY